MNILQKISDSLWLDPNSIENTKENITEDQDRQSHHTCSPDHQEIIEHMVESQKAKLRRVEANPQNHSH